MAATDVLVASLIGLQHSLLFHSNEFRRVIESQICAWNFHMLVPTDFGHTMLVAKVSLWGSILTDISLTTFDSKQV